MISLIEQLNILIAKAINEQKSKVINKTMVFKQGTNVTAIHLGKVSY